MAEAHRVALAAAGGEIDQRARDRGGGTDRDGGRAHHRVVQLAHRQRAHQQVDVAGRDLLAAGRDVVGRLRDERDLRRVLALGRFVDVL